MRVLLLDSDFKKWLWIPTAVTIMIIVININNKTSVHHRNTHQTLKITCIFFSNADDKDSHFGRLAMEFKTNSALFRHWLILLSV